MDDDENIPLSHARSLLYHAARPSQPLRDAVRLVNDRIDADARRIEACDAEMDRLNSALVDALAERDAALADVAKLREALRRVLDDTTNTSDHIAARHHARTVLAEEAQSDADD